MPSAAVAAASLASPQASTVRFTRFAYEDSGRGLSILAVLMRTSFGEAGASARNSASLRRLLTKIPKMQR